MVGERLRGQVSARVDNVKGTVRGTFENLKTFVMADALGRVKSGTVQSPAILSSKPNIVDAFGDIFLREKDIVVGHIQTFARLNRDLLGGVL